MIVISLWQWWYQKGWLLAAGAVLSLLKRQVQEFSVPILLRTLLSPWKQTIDIAGPNTPLQVRVQWWVGNQVSRFIGLLIRAITLAIALVVIVATAVLGTALLLSWFILPPLSLVMLVGGLVRLWT